MKNMEITYHLKAADWNKVSTKFSAAKVAWWQSSRNQAKSQDVALVTLKRRSKILARLATLVAR